MKIVIREIIHNENYRSGLMSLMFTTAKYVNELPFYLSILRILKFILILFGVS